MEDTRTPLDLPDKAKAKKGVSIQLMFPCESDDVALDIKKKIDDVVKDIVEKRYTFSISEV